MMRPKDLVEHIEKTCPRQGTFKPFAYYDSDGDCIEFFVSNEPFVGERVDNWVTVYHGETSKKIIGSLIKGVSRLLSQYPGLKIDIECGQVRISHILRARAWSVDNGIVQRSYKRIIEVAEQDSITAELVIA